MGIKPSQPSNDSSIPIITVITPTTGKDSLFDLIESLTKQNVRIVHVLLWDDVREGHFDKFGRMKPEDLDKKEYWYDHGYLVQNIVMKGQRINGKAAGSALRAIGLMAANTEIVTFADDDVTWSENHASSMLFALNNKKWAYCKRNIWAKAKEKDGSKEFLGIDNFESVGEDAKTPYKMVDNNSMMFRRRFGVSASPLYRETNEYNDDRLMYSFLREYAGDPGKTNMATVNQTCPDRLIDFFRENCTKIKSMDRHTREMPNA